MARHNSRHGLSGQVATPDEIALQAGKDRGLFKPGAREYKT